MNRYEVDLRNPETFKQYVKEAWALDVTRDNTVKGAKLSDKFYQEALDEQRKRQEREITVEE